MVRFQNKQVDIPEEYCKILKNINQIILKYQCNRIYNKIYITGHVAVL